MHRSSICAKEGRLVERVLTEVALMRGWSEASACTQPGHLCRGPLHWLKPCTHMCVHAPGKARIINL